MLCKIADLYVEISGAGGMASRLRDYVTTDVHTPDILISEDMYDKKRWKSISDEYLPYMDSGWLFYVELVRLGGMMLHASAIELDGRAYLFSGPSGMGKSTHTGLWQQLFPDARNFNDDKPALRQIEGVWYAYGTPWSGKHGININLKAPIAGICFLRKGKENTIRRLPKREATAAILSQTINSFANHYALSLFVDVVDRLVGKVPVYELICRPDPEAAILSHEVMSKEAEVTTNEN